jgi:hypothetical protein
MANNYNERIAATREKISQYENQMKQLLQKQKAQERKERTLRLIERGAILESLIDGADSLTNEQIKTLLEKTVQTDIARKILAGMTPPIGVPAEQETARAGGAVTAQAVGDGAGAAG